MKMKNDALGNRMKAYEDVYKTKLIPRSYTIIRLDGRSFHVYTKGLNKPFDKGLVEDIISTTKYLCENIQGCKFGYVQSDEITLVLTDFDTYETQAWFGNEIQKILSISASMATSQFNHLRVIRKLSENINNEVKDIKNIQPFILAHFDSRVFQVPNLTEVYNCLLWRQKDAIRNSISSCAQALYSAKQLNGMPKLVQLELISDKAEEFKSTMLKCGYDIGLVFNYSIQAWHMLPYELQRGTAFFKELGEWLSGPYEFTQELIEKVIPNNI